MATLILTAVGTAVGGPIGGAIGAAVGQTADAMIFAPRPRQGPRLGDLSVQTSSYGTAIPKLFGRLRVAGTVIWATDLKETATTAGGGKGGPRTRNYSYSASFAVALSGRAIRAVHRIWADGKLLRGAAGDFKSKTGYRLYPGSEEQDVDPLIAAAEGAAQAPAFRGTAYAMFEDFELADYGNRIPSLTFEVEADAADVEVGEIAEALSGGAVRGGAAPAVQGYAASGDSVRAAVEALGDVAPLSLSDEGAWLRLGSPVAASEGLPDDLRPDTSRRAAGTVPGEVSIAYHDPARDYQTGLQRASRGGPAHRSDRRALPAAIAAEDAKSFAEMRLASLWAARESAEVELGWRSAALWPGQVLTLPGEAGQWRIARWTLKEMSVRLELVRLPASPTLAPSATAGRPIGHADLVHGATVIHLLELPLAAGTAAGERPILLVAAAGAEPGWRRAGLLASFDAGASWSDVGGTALPAVMGVAETVLPESGSALMDFASSVDVELLNDGMWLESRDDAALAGGANLALVGDELVQFGSVQQLGSRRFRLSRLLRGRRGTEWATVGHQAGERFVVIEPSSLLPIEAPAGSIGAEASVIASGVGDGLEGVADARIISGEALRPPSPVHLSAERMANGDIAISWVRRSRMGWHWVSGSETPLGEEAEGYELLLSAGSSQRREILSAASFLYTSELQAADGLADVLAITVNQIGTWAASRATTISFHQ